MTNTPADRGRENRNPRDQYQTTNEVGTVIT